MANHDYITRSKAKSRGLARYFTGKPCKHGHVANRFVSSGYCSECANRVNEKRRHRVRPCRKRKKAFSFERKEALKNGDATFTDGFPCPKGHTGEKYAKSGGCKECKREYLNTWRDNKRKQEYPEGKKSWKKCEPGHKVCASCRTAKPHNEYTSHAALSDGLQPSCRACQNSAKRKRYWDNPELARGKFREYRERNPEVVKEVNRKQREGENRESILERKRQEYYRNREDPEWQEKQKKHRRLTKSQKRDYDKEYVKNNREKVNRQARQWAENNPEQRRAICLNNAAKRRAQKEHGCSSREIKEWSQSQKKVCYWCEINCQGNYHIDHYIPLSKGGEHKIDNLVISCPSCNFRKSAKDPYDFAQERGKLF